MLPDGTYDVFVVDATDQDGGAVSLDLTVTAGDHKGEVLAVTATGLGRGEIDLLGMPATLVVLGGTPHITIDG